MKECFGPARILLPDEEIPVEQWACLACDQFTSQPEYWQRAEAMVREKPSALHIVLPEIYLGEADLPQRIEQIHQAMEEYAEKYLTRQVEGFVYLERDLGARAWWAWWTWKPMIITRAVPPPSAPPRTRW